MWTPASKGWGLEPSAVPRLLPLPSCWAPRRVHLPSGEQRGGMTWRGGQGPLRDSSSHSSGASLGTCGQSSFRSGQRVVCRREGQSSLPHEDVRGARKTDQTQPTIPSPKPPVTSECPLSPGFLSTSLNCPPLSWAPCVQLEQKTLGVIPETTATPNAHLQVSISSEDPPPESHSLTHDLAPHRHLKFNTTRSELTSP